MDFSPDLLFLVVGTNDIYDVSVSTEEVANSIFNLAEVIHSQSKTQRIVIVQVLNRHPPSVAVRYPVDVDVFYNNRVDQLNKRLSDFASNMPWCYFWRLRGFWATNVNEQVFAADGCHLTDMCHKKLYINISVAVVATVRGSIFSHIQDTSFILWVRAFYAEDDKTGMPAYLFLATS